MTTTVGGVRWVAVMAVVLSVGGCGSGEAGTCGPLADRLNAAEGKVHDAESLADFHAAAEAWRDAGCDRS